MENLYSKAKLQKTFIDGKPAITAGKEWYVYYYFRNPTTGKMQKFKPAKLNINKHKTVKERTEAGEAWVKAWDHLLDNGFNPFTKVGIVEKVEPNFLVKNFTIVAALEYAYENKIGEWEPATISDYKTRKNLFIQWLTSNNLQLLDVNDFQDIHFISFMNWLVSPEGRNVGKTSQDNYKRCLSSLFGKLVKDKIISKNPVDFETSKNKPEKNKPFTGYEVLAIRDYLLENDLQLYYFILFVIYAFLRPVEIIRLVCGSFNMKEKYLNVKTKTDPNKVKKIIAPINNYLKLIDVTTLPKKAHLFTNTGDFIIWDASEKSKVDHFGNRFKKVKLALGFGEDYGIYSFRHTAAIDVYNSLLKNGKSHRDAVQSLMNYIGHKNEKTTEIYLREVQEMLPKDYGEFYTLDF